MSAAAVEHPCDGEPPTLLEEADTLMEQLPGYRVEIIGGILTVTPPPDVPHARALNKVVRPFVAAGLDDGETEVFQGIGVWLPNGPEDFAAPDLAIVDADIEGHLMSHNCYDPVVFRLVLEVTSSNYNQDLRAKVAAYAEADIPVYVIVNRKHQRVHVLTEPVGNDYAGHQIYAAGQQASLRASIGADVTLDVAAILLAGTKTPAKG